MPYIYSLLNCLICMWYGLPFVSYGVVLVATVNSIGAAFQLAYSAVFIAFAADARQRVGRPYSVWQFFFLCVLDCTDLLKVSVPCLAVEGVWSAGGRRRGVRPDRVCQFGVVRSPNTANVRRIPQRCVPDIHVRVPIVHHCEFMSSTDAVGLGF
jgi:hypothetical protein